MATSSSASRFLVLALAAGLGAVLLPGNARADDLFVSTGGAQGVTRQPLQRGASGAYLPPATATFASGGALANPHGLAKGPDGRLYVASVGTDEVLRFDLATGAFVDVFASGARPGGRIHPHGMVFGKTGDLLVINRDASSVRRYAATDGSYLGDFVAPGAGGLLNPLDLAFGPDGNLYVTSYLGRAVLRYDGQTGAFLDTFATGAPLEAPTGLSFAPDGSLFVGNDGDSTVVRYTT
ncbi:MAG TPA: hypothetical protein VHF22_10910, partial [Planctomycetota bacterium]|nr:hypothetical protein [Planctomycetota bacterium]